jgi:hypothetical protein
VVLTPSDFASSSNQDLKPAGSVLFSRYRFTVLEGAGLAGSFGAAEWHPDISSIVAKQQEYNNERMAATDFISLVP